jgi:hypothetical protein
MDAFGTKEQDAVIYKIRLEIKRPVRSQDWDETVSETINYMTSTVAARALEKEILKALAKLDGDVWDIEVMDTVVEED